MELNKWKRKDLLALPERNWQTPSQYDSLILVDTRKKHDSGFGWMALVGVRDQVPVEIAAHCDDLEWIVDAPTMCASFKLANLRMDLLRGCGCVHAWTRHGVFKVGTSLSSTEVEVTSTKP